MKFEFNSGPVVSGEMFENADGPNTDDGVIGIYY